MNQIVADNRARLRSQGVDRPHIAQLELPNVMEMIEFDQIAFTGGFAVTPRPTH